MAFELIEDRVRISVRQVRTVGGLAPLRWASSILLDNLPVAIRRDRLNRIWFACPQCNQRRRHLYFPNLTCRICSGLDFASRHGFNRAVPSLGRVQRWRRQIGADPQLFADLPKRQRHHVRFHRIVARIIAEEKKLVGQLHRSNQNLARRLLGQKPSSSADL